MQNIEFAAVGCLLCRVALPSWWPQFQDGAPVNIISQDKMCTDFLQNKQPIQAAGLLHYVCLIIIIHVLIVIILQCPRGM